MLPPSCTPQPRPPHVHSVSRRAMLQAGLAAGVTLSTWLLHHPSTLWGAEAGQPKRGGILRVRGYDPPHFDPHQTNSFKTHTTLSFVYSNSCGIKSAQRFRPGPSSWNPIWPNAGKRWTTRPMLFISAKELHGTTNHRSMAVSWWPRMSNSPMTAS
jgi:hypothetical protein